MLAGGRALGLLELPNSSVTHACLRPCCDCSRISGGVFLALESTFGTLSGMKAGTGLRWNSDGVLNDMLSISALPQRCRVPNPGCSTTKMRLSVGLAGIAKEESHHADLMAYMTRSVLPEVSLDPSRYKHIGQVQKYNKIKRQSVFGE